MEESDTELAELLRKHSSNPARVRILKKDTLSASELRSVIARAQAMIGFRLHSNIIGVSAGVPSVNVYYVDKGRVFFDQIGMSQYALPIEATLEDDFVTKLIDRFDAIYNDRAGVKKAINQATAKLRHQVKQSFNDTFTD